MGYMYVRNHSTRMFFYHLHPLYLNEPLVYLNEPLDKLCESRQCILVMHLLDDKDGQRGLVPVQLLTPRVWNGPEANVSISNTCIQPQSLAMIVA